MDKNERILKRKILLCMLFGIICPILFIAGIPCLVVFMGSTAVMVLSIIGIVAGFYGTPVIWAIGYPAARARLKTYKAIMKQDIKEIAVLSNYLNKTPKNVTNIVRSLIAREYLEGYTISSDGKYIVHIKDGVADSTVNVKNEEKLIVCNSCGAKYLLSAKNKACPYCGTPNK